MSLFALKGSSGDNSSHPSMEYGQCPHPSTSVPQENLFQVTLKVSEIYDEVLLLNFKFFMLSKVYCYYYYFYCIIYYYNALFSET